LVRKDRIEALVLALTQKRYIRYRSHNASVGEGGVRCHHEAGKPWRLIDTFFNPDVQGSRGSDLLTKLRMDCLDLIQKGEEVVNTAVAIHAGGHFVAAHFRLFERAL
jgi:hypothetical protein